MRFAAIAPSSKQIRQEYQSVCRLWLCNIWLGRKTPEIKDSVSCVGERAGKRCIYIMLMDRDNRASISFRRCRRYIHTHLPLRYSKRGERDSKPVDIIQHHQIRKGISKGRKNKQKNNKRWWSTRQYSVCLDNRENPLRLCTCNCYPILFFFFSLKKSKWKKEEKV